MPASAAAASVDPALRGWATAALPAASTAAIEVHRLSLNFREATRTVQRPLPAVLPPGCVLVRRLYAGINASDVNYSAGRWAGAGRRLPTGGATCSHAGALRWRGSFVSVHAASLPCPPTALLSCRYFGSVAAAEKRLPFDAGFEAVGVVAAAAPGVESVAVGQPVATMTYGGFAGQWWERGLEGYEGVDAGGRRRLVNAASPDRSSRLPLTRTTSAHPCRVGGGGSQAGLPRASSHP
jgi:hypothetical protein